MTIGVYLEQGARRTFACAIDWPGWCRVARGDEAAIALLASYAGRYAAVAAEAGVDFPVASASADVVGDLDVIERVRGSGATDFGAPDAITPGRSRTRPTDRAPIATADPPVPPPRPLASALSVEAPRIQRSHRRAVPGPLRR
jgi:hypothetical protein